MNKDLFNIAKIVYGKLKPIVSQKRTIQVLDYLINTKGRFSVTELFIHFRCEQSDVSQALRVLYRSHFVLRYREGKNIYYKANLKEISRVFDICEKIVE